MSRTRATTRRNERHPQRLPAVDSASRQPPRASAIILVTFVAVFSAIEIVSYRSKSATWDEPIHLTTGYVALTQRDYRIDPSHPPFLREWAALPLAGMRGRVVDSAQIDRTPVQEWLDSASYDFSRKFLYSRDDADRLLLAARVMMLLWGIAGGILLFCWAREWLGLSAAATALAFYSMEPNIVAHAALVTTDLGVTSLLFGAIYFLWRTCRQATPQNVVGLSLCCALAFVSKFSALVLGPIVLTLLALCVWQRSMTLRRAAALVSLIAVAVVVSIWAAYGFRYAPSASSTWILHLENAPSVRQYLPHLAPVVVWIDRHHLLPNAFTQGFLYSQATVNQGYLAGRYSTHGWWYYFPFAFFIKTPIALMVMFGAGLGAYVKRHSQFGRLNIAFVCLPVAIYLGFAMTSPFNIGLRHILPIFPFVLLIAAAGAQSLLRGRGRAGKIALGLLALCCALEFGSVYPNTLTFFNLFVGGPRNGFRYLADSNLGWGQQLRALKHWMDENGVSHINLAYFGQVDPAYYGIDCTHLPGAPTFAQQAIGRPQLPGYVAISPTVLSGVYLQPRWRVFYRPFRDLQPVAIIGNSMRVYWVDTWPIETIRDDVARRDPSELDAHRMLGDALLLAMSWYEPAGAYYRQYLSYRPGDTAALSRFGIALAQAGETAGAIDVFRRVVDLAPDDDRAHQNLARALLHEGHAVEANVHAREAASLNPGDANTHALLARTLAVQQKFREALREFQRAVELDPTHPDAREGLARLNDNLQQVAVR